MVPPANRGLSFRKIERRVKDWLIFRLAALMKPRQPPNLPDWASGPHRVLVLRYDRIGDMILSTGIFKAIALAQPTVVVDVLASVQNASVLHGNPYVGSILTIDRRRPWTWIAVLSRVRRIRYDAVIDVMVMAPSLTTTLVMWLCGARHRIGLGDRGHREAFTLPVERLHDAVHYVDHSAALLAAFGVDPPSIRALQARRTASQPGALRGARLDETRIGGWGIWRPEIFLTATEIAGAEAHWSRVASIMGPAAGPACRLVVNVSAGGTWRHWPVASFVEALRAIRARFPALQCLLIGAPHDAERMQTIGRASGVLVAHTARTRDMMAIIATSDAVFTPDTAVTHVASAFDRPILAMFARGKAALWGPYDIPGGVVSTPGKSLDSLAVAAVLPALIELVEIATPARRGLPLRATAGNTRSLRLMK
jgi:heptosyltransferase II